MRPAADFVGRVGSIDVSKQLYADRDGARAAQRFLQVLGADSDATYQTIPEAGQRSSPAVIHHGAFADCEREFDSLNRAGHGVFVMVNEGDGQGRTRRNVVRVRALFVDLDGAPMPSAAEVPLTPHLAVESSPGRYHLYWLVENVPLRRFAEMQWALAKLYGGDPAVKDLPRLMRLPGFLHWKDAPFRSRLLGVYEGPAYRLEDLLEGLPGLSATVSARRQLSSSRSRPVNLRYYKDYARDAFRQYVTWVGTAQIGGRNTKLNSAAYYLGQLVRDGMLPVDEVAAALMDAALAVGLSAREAAATIASGLNAGTSWRDEP